MDRRITFSAGGVVAAAVLMIGTASAASVRDDEARMSPQQAATATPTVTPSATATPRTGGPPSNPGQGQGNRPENPGQGQGNQGLGNRPQSTGATGASGSTGAGTGASGPRPQLPAQASPRAKAAVEAAAKKHDLLRERLAALKAIPRDADRAVAVRAVMADFGELFRLVSDAVHSVDPTKASPTATPAGTATGTATATATGTVIPTQTATGTTTPTPTATTQP